MAFFCMRVILTCLIENFLTSSVACVPKVVLSSNRFISVTLIVNQIKMVYKPNQRKRNAVKIFLEYREILQNMLQTNNQNIKYVKHP